MSDPATTVTPPPERVAPIIGAFVVIVAVSSLLDDTGLLRHPWWVPVVVGVALAALAGMARTVRRLVNYDA